MNILTRIKKLEGERPSRGGSVATFITIYERKDGCEGDVRCALLIWEKSGGVHLTPLEEETNEQFRERVSLTKRLTFSEAKALQERRQTQTQSQSKL